MDQLSTVFLGVIAATTLGMFILQTVAMVAMRQLSTRVEELGERAEAFAARTRADLEPVLRQLVTAADEVARVAQHGDHELQRLDHTIAQFRQRAHSAADLALNAAVYSPVRRGAALAAGLRAAYTAFTRMRSRRSDAPRRTVGPQPEHTPGPRPVDSGVLASRVR